MLRVRGALWSRLFPFASITSVTFEHFMTMTTAERQRRYRAKHGDEIRARDRARRQKERTVLSVQKTSLHSNPDRPARPASAVAEWSRSKLIVPPGHPLEGQPLELPDYGIGFLKDALAPECKEAALIVARKNAKSAIVACLILAHLADDGPLRRKGWRAGVVSLSKEKAGELKRQVEAIATASGVKGVKFLRTAPGIVSRWGMVDILASGADAGAASGFDCSIVDEIGLMKERDRALINGMRSAVSAKRGRFISLSVYGSGPFVPEIQERSKAGDPGLRLHLYQSDPGKPIDSEDNFHRSNPGLSCGIKSLEHMRSEARRVLVTVSDQASFRSLELNLPGSPSRELLCTPQDWAALEVSTLPPRSGGVFIGFDCGGARAMTALVAFFPSSGRFEAWAALPGTPNLKERGQADGVGDLYEEMQRRGELAIYAGRLVPVGEFLKDCAARIAGCKVIAAGADRYRRAETLSAIEDASLNWPMAWRGTGSSSTADGSFDCRSFQKLVYEKRIQVRESFLIRSAIGESVITGQHHSQGDIQIFRCGSWQPRLKLEKSRGATATQNLKSRVSTRA